MIRGILLLILSCVVLTFQQSPCTCEQNAKPSVYDYSDSLYPVTSAGGIDTVKPDAGYADLLTRCSKLNSKTLLRDTTTSQFQTMENEGKASANALTNELTKLKAQRESVQKEIKMVSDSINNDCRYLDTITETIYEPLPAIDHCTRSLYILSRQKYCDRLIKFLDATIAVKLDLQVQLDKYISLVGTAISISKNIDGLLKLCPLGLCSRGTVVGTLVDPLLAVLTTGVTACLRSIADLKVRVDAAISIGNLADIKLAVDVDADISLNLIRNHFFDTWGILERCGGRSFNDIQLIIPELLHNTAIITSVIKPLFYGYVLGQNNQFLCTGYNDPLSKTMTCTYTTKIGLDINIGNIVKLDVRIAALKLAHICRVVMLALTGSHFIDATVLTASVDGTVAIQILLPRDCHEMIQSVYQKPEIVQGCGIDAITSGGKVNEDVLAAVQDRSTIDELRSKLERSITDCKNSVAQVNIRIGASLDIATSLTQDLGNSVTGLLATVLPSEIAQIAFDRCVAYKTGVIDIFTTVLSVFERTKLQVLAKVSLCQIALVEAKIQLDANPGNQLYSDRYTQCHQAYMDSLTAAIRIHVQVSSLCDVLNAKIGIEANLLDTVKADLQLNLEAIVSGVVKVLSALKVEILVKLHVFIGRITDCITAFRPSCGILNLVFIGLETEGSDIELSVKITDSLQLGETIEDLINLHRIFIKASVILSIGCTDVEVDVVVGTGDHYEYQCRIIQ